MTKYTFEHYSEDEKKLTKELNTTGVIPLRTKVLIKMDSFQKATSGGIIIPDTSKRGTYRGIVIALGSYARQEELQGEPEYIKVGDKVEIKEYDGIDIINPDDRLMSKDVGKFRMVEYTEIISKVL